MSRCLSLTPHDTAFFRDARPFSQDDAGIALGESLFPPSPRTVTACMRTAMAEAMGWRGGDWSRDQAIRSAVGVGDDLGAFSISGFCLHDGSNAYYPAPQCLAARAGADGEIAELLILKPGEAAMVSTDIGDFTLPRLDGPGAKPLVKYWISRDGMTRLLSGQPVLSTYLRPEGEFVVVERRVGVERVSKTRQVREGMLYSVDQIRLRDDMRLLVEYASSDSADVSTYRPFGGEGRFGWIEKNDAPWRPVDSAGSNRVLAVALTPIRCDPGLLRPAAQFFDTGLKIASVCMERPTRIGGWSSMAANFGPQPLKSTIPAGATFFLEEDATARAEPLPKQVGEEKAFGYGAVCYGRWGE